MGTSGLPERRRARTAAASSLLALTCGATLLLPTTGASAAGGPPPVRLRPVAGSVVRSAAVPLTSSSLHDVAPGRSERRTTQLGTGSYDLVGVTWRASAATASAAPHLRVRTRSAGAWSDWEPLPALTDLPDAATSEGRASTAGTEPLWVGPSDGVQVSLRGPRPDDLSLVLIDPGHRAADSAVAAATSPRTTTTTRPDHAPRPVILSRRQWGADESWRDGGPWYDRTIQQVHIHHTVNANDYSRADVPALIRGMYRYHTHDLGWSDIGYNFLVDRFGRIWQGRAGGNGKPVRGAHTLGFNDTSAGISVIGNFDEGRPGQKVLTAIVHLAAWKLDRYHRDPQGTARVYSHGSDDYPAGRTVRLPVIDGHRDTNQTACPGQHLYDLLPGIRRRAQSRVDRF